LVEKPGDRTVEGTLDGIPGPLPIKRVADPENRLLDAEEASGWAAPLIAKLRAKTARLERMLLDRAG
jgi:hypothetical protein